MNELVSKWQKTGLLSHLNNEIKESVVNCLETQRECNKKNTNIPESFLRVSIPIIIRSIATSETIKRNKFIINETDSESQIHVFKVKYKLPKQSDLEEETKSVTKFSKLFREEFDELFKDQVNKNICFKGLSCNETGDVILFYDFY